MRLLKRSSDGDFELISVNDDNPPPYAILSHTWITTATESHEVTYNELVAGIRKDKAGYEKILFCGERAAADGLSYFWVDTCCIDKSTSNELNSAINSMFRWYRRAAKCYVYLSDVSVAARVTNAEASQSLWENEFRHSRWFTRGWTLQELIAPNIVEFFSKEGKLLGSRTSLEQVIHDITKIPVGVLKGQTLADFGVEERMNWVAGRTTTMIEDKVYCLLGLFGVFLPLIYGEGEEYAKARLSEEIQKRQKGLGSERLHVISASSLLPFERNEFFIGREDQLKQLDKDLFDPNHHKRMTLYGLGGCGKSALALEFVYRALARDASLLVFWVPALSQESFELAYREIARYLRIPGISDENADIVALVKETLSSGSSGDWLMIVDNADDLNIMFGTTNNGGPASVQLIDCLPYGNQGTVLFTTRSKDIAEVLTPDSFMGLNDLSKPEARQLLARRVTRKALLSSETAVDELLETLTYFPLAIVQAAAFINNNRITVSEYRSLFQHPGSEVELFTEHFEDPSRYPDMDNTIATTWHISFNQLRRQNPLAAKYISFMACIDRFNIPQSLLPAGGTPVQQLKAIGTLLGYAFITRRQQADQEPGVDKFFDMHRLVHMASVGWLNKHGERATGIADVVARLEELIPVGGQMEKKELWRTYLPHAIYVAGLDDLQQTVKGSLLDRVACCQATLGQYAVATETYRQALTIRFDCLGREHPDSLKTISALANVHGELGKYQQATELHKRTLAQRKKVLGPNHQDTLESMNNLAVGLKNLRHYAEAEELHKQTLERQTTLFGLKHIGTLLSMSNLAELLAIRGKYKEADDLYLKTMRAQEEVYGERHPTVLQTRYNMAKVSERIQDDADGFSEESFREVLKFQEEVLGPDHPATLTTLQSLAALRARLGHLEEAEATYRRILAQRIILLGPNHLLTLEIVYALASMLKEQRRWGESSAFFQQAGSGYYHAFNNEHPTYKHCIMEMVKTRERESFEEYCKNPPEDPTVYVEPPPPMDPIPTIHMEGHPNGNQSPWDGHLPQAIEFTTGKKPNLARSLVAKIGFRKLVH